MDAALKLGAQKRSLTSVGLRELAREAGLNPNTFYRHFADMDELAAALMKKFGEEVRATLKHLRHSAQKGNIHRDTVRYVFDYARAHPDAFILAVREQHGASPLARKSLRELMAGLSRDMADDVRQLALFPELDDDALAEVSTMVVQQLFSMCLDYLEQPRARAQILERAVRFVEMMFAGALLLKSGVVRPLVLPD